MRVEYTPECLDALREQEEILRFERFGAVEALSLGNIIAELALEYDRGVSAAIIREADSLTLFAYSMDDKAPRNFTFIDGKRKTAVACGHCSLWAYVEHELNGAWEKLFNQSPPYILSGGAFPIRVQDAWTATLAVSGLHNGKDHELVVRALSRMLGRTVPDFPGVMV